MHSDMPSHAQMSKKGKEPMDFQEDMTIRVHTRSNTTTVVEKQNDDMLEVLCAQRHQHEEHRQQSMQFEPPTQVELDINMSKFVEDTQEQDASNNMQQVDKEVALEEVVTNTCVEEHVAKLREQKERPLLPTQEQHKSKDTSCYNINGVEFHIRKEGDEQQSHIANEKDQSNRDKALVCNAKGKEHMPLQGVNGSVGKENVQPLRISHCVVSCTHETFTSAKQRIISEREEARQAEKAWREEEEKRAKKRALQVEELARENELFAKKYAKPISNRIVLKGDSSSDEVDEVVRERLLQKYNCMLPASGSKAVNRDGIVHVPKTELVEEQWMRKRKAEIDIELTERMNKIFDSAIENMLKSLYADLLAGRVQIPVLEPSSRSENLSKIEATLSTARFPIVASLPLHATSMFPNSSTREVSLIVRQESNMVLCTPVLFGAK